MLAFRCIPVPWLAAAATVHAAIVYDNTATRMNVVNALLPAGQVNSVEHGNQVTLAGPERMITSIAIYLRIQGAGVASFNARVRFYVNDGPDGRPGTLLWDSGPVFRLIDSGADILYSFSVPDVLVPAMFTYTIQVTDRQQNMALMGPSDYHPPAIGSAPFGFWRRFGLEPADWEFTGLNEPPFGARVLAEPRPGDCDDDGDVDLSDAVDFLTCMDGPELPVAPLCDCADLQADEDVDLADFAELQETLDPP